MNKDVFDSLATSAALLSLSRRENELDVFLLHQVESSPSLRHEPKEVQDKWVDFARIRRCEMLPPSRQATQEIPALTGKAFMAQECCSNGGRAKNPISPLRLGHSVGSVYLSSWSDNPYQDGTPEYAAWKDGFQSARNEE